MRREHSGNKALSDMHRKMNNSLFEKKTLENAFKYRKFVIHKGDAIGPNGQTNAFLSEAKNFLEVDSYFFCEFENTEVLLNKPVQIGFAILELAKLEVYKFFYNLNAKFGKNMLLLYHDTDFLLLKFENYRFVPTWSSEQVRNAFRTDTVF